MSQDYFDVLGTEELQLGSRMRFGVPPPVAKPSEAKPRKAQHVDDPPYWILAGLWRPMHAVEIARYSGIKLHELVVYLDDLERQGKLRRREEEKWERVPA